MLDRWNLGLGGQFSRDRVLVAAPWGQLQMSTLLGEEEVPIGGRGQEDAGLDRGSLAGAALAYVKF